ncbi:MAG: S-methyl-5'-thioadenosine phosphorylase [Dehalococcoidia bacterium]|nr:S-methyl-5'-thioadenosine phosphorylase [Dehalococcoidia bacterium]
MSEIAIGIIGGSGLYQIDAMTDVSEVRVDTPYGAPSDAIITGTLEGKRVAFLPRHGKGHRLNPGEVPYRANIYALKTLGVKRVVSVNAVGSLRLEMPPMDIVIPDQIIDRTRGRVSTFFEKGIVAHVAFAEPFCSELRSIVGEAATAAGARVHNGGTYIAMEGPQFSTRAESELYRSWNADIIGMTAIPEAKLAREAEMCYAVVAFVTDYDCWYPEHGSVTTEMVIKALLTGADTARAIVTHAVRAMTDECHCGCQTALSDAIVTAPHLVPEDIRKNLEPIAGQHFSGLSK